jgi:protein SCO1
MSGPARWRAGFALALLALLALLAGLIVCGCGSSSGGEATAASFPGGDAVPSRPAPAIDLTDYRGRPVDLARLKGKPVLVAFLYTHCHDLCPIVAGKLHTAFAELPPAKRPLFLAISVDPAHDTPSSAIRFNRQHRTSGEINWLLGSRAELKRVWSAWGVKPERDAKDPEEIEHNAEIFAIDPQGQVRALYPPDFNPTGLAAGVKTLRKL